MERLLGPLCIIGLRSDKDDIDAMSWEVFYSDGTTISSQDATPFSIFHREDVQVIIQPSDEHNWVTLTGTDYYVWDDRGKGAKWWGVNDRSGLDWYFRKPGYKCILFGSWIETEDFRHIFNQARESWGNKEVFANDERQP